MDGRDEQTELLRSIWNEIKALGTNLGGRIDQTNARLDELSARVDHNGRRIDATNARLDETNARLDETNQRLGGLEQRTGVIETTLTELATQQVFLSRFVRHAVDQDIAELKARVSKLEAERA